MSPAELDQRHLDLKARMPRAWHAFFAGFDCLRPVQLAAIPAILDGRSALVTAPTAGGKTEAVMAPICERLAQEAWPGLAVLLITPTRALVNDLFQRLTAPCSRMNVRLGRKTADHAMTGDLSEQILITTPESTESLLTFRRKCLANVRAVVLDEIHLLDGSPRGDQLRLILSRLSAYLHYRAGGRFPGLQLVAMSATAADPQALAEAYLGPGACVIVAPGRRKVESKVATAAGPLPERVGTVVRAIEEFADVRKVLVFVNSRKQVDAATAHFKAGRFAHSPVFGHHGSLSKAKREEVETQFKSARQAVCVATMTLEVGIDIGDIDLVVCMDPPFSVSSFLQRIGRGCRRLGGLTRVLCVAAGRTDELIFKALIRQAEIGVPAAPQPPFRRSVLVQQILAYLRQVGKHRRVLDQFLNVFTSACRPCIPADYVKQTLESMIETGLLDRRGNVYQPASDGWAFIAGSRIYSNIQPTPLEIALRDVDSGQTVVSVAALTSPLGVRVAGQSYHLLPGGWRLERLVRAGGKHSATPRYHPRRLPFAYDIGAALAGMLEVPPHVLLTLKAGGGVILMTWLGELFNQMLVAGLARNRVNAEAGSFHIWVEDPGAEGPIELLRRAVRRLIRSNPLGSVKIERAIDIGPHFCLLSPELQKQARRDWLDAGFLADWIASIEETRAVPADSDLGSDLLALC